MISRYGFSFALNYGALHLNIVNLLNYKRSPYNSCLDSFQKSVSVESLVSCLVFFFSGLL